MHPEQHVVAFSADVILQIWRAISANDVHECRKRCAAYLDSTPGQKLCLVVLEPNVEVPEKDARVALTDMARFLMPRTHALAYAYQDTGMRAAAMRGIMTGSFLMQRQPFPTKVVATVDLALQFLADKAAPGHSSTPERNAFVHATLRAFRDKKA